MSVSLTLKVFKGNLLVGTKEFNRDIIKIGRLSSAHLSLEDDRISRIHSVIQVSSDNQISILDMGSTEGTFVNGKRVSKGTLNNGDEITLGATKLLLEIGAAVADPAGNGMRASPISVVDGNAAVAMQPQPITQPPLQAAPPPPPIAAVPLMAPAPVSVAPVVRQRRGGVLADISLSHRGRGASVVENDRDAEEAVEVRVFWGDTLLGSTIRVKPKQITVGEDAGADFVIPALGLPGPRFAIVTTQNGAVTLRFTKAMEGEFQPANQTPIRFADLIARGQASAQDGAYALSLPLGSFAWASVGNLTFEVEVNRVPKRAVAPFWEGLDLRFVNVALLMCFGILAFIISAATFPFDTDTTADDLFRNPHAMAKFVVKPPETVKNPFLDKLKSDADKGREKGEQAEKRAGAEGKAGKKNAPQKNAKAAPKAIDLNAKEIVKNSALLKALGQSGGLSTILGQGGLGGTLNGALGHLTGAASGDAGGLGGLGLRGGGLGGGGFGNTIGIGDIGTRGRGGGLNGYGSSVGTLGKKTSSDVAISSGNPIVEGSMDKELIRRVIHEHRNQVRYCYESELQRHPGLNGKVTVKFVIGPAGQVQKSGIDSSSLGSPPVENCIVARVYQWQFPKPKGGGIVQVSYPFLLKESGD